jgi:hypothetical protein
MAGFRRVGGTPLAARRPALCNRRAKHDETFIEGDPR